MEKVPLELFEFIQNHGKHSPDCDGCKFSCCFQSGFAIKRNVELIYKKYKNGELKRSDYIFKLNLDYESFVRIYFDVIAFKELNLVLYFPRHLAYDNVALIINPVDNINYWSLRSEILKNPINECKGCIFLESSMSLKDQKVRNCILHHTNYNDYIYEKPIDCVMQSCNSSKKMNILSSEQSNKYFNLLSKYFGE